MNKAINKTFLNLITWDPKRAQVDLVEKLGEKAFFAYAYYVVLLWKGLAFFGYVIRHFVNSNGPGLEPVDHTRPTYRRRGWPRGLGALNSSPHS